MVTEGNFGLSLFHARSGGSRHDVDENFECTKRSKVFGDVVKEVDHMVASFLIRTIYSLLRYVSRNETWIKGIP
ncbi:hypothetical protein Aduo_011956 [Ancylostoma duodenale]